MRRAERISQHKLIEEIVGRQARRHSTAVVLFHHAVAERLGLGPTDRKCLDLLRDRGAMTGSELAAITGLTSGAITGVVARLERAGYLRREPDPHDGRKQILHLALERAHIQDIIKPLREDVAAMLEKFDTHQLTAIAEFMARFPDLAYRHAALLRAEALCAESRPGGTAQAATANRAREKSEIPHKRSRNRK
jgi:DNA-binding MarR family transcriptional regulator